MGALLGALMPSILQVLGRVLPDPQAAAEAKLKLLEMAQQGELAQLDADMKLALGQMDINRAEAQSGSLFIGGWRPAVGWVCVLGLAYQFLAYPLLAWLGANVAGWSAPPELDIVTLLSLVSGMLGLGWFRTNEKIKGVAKP
ncbi:MAG TPA: holin family protein [Immundisolibacter sp.]|nr:holin family protein [Immundisolibacter sp.]